MKEKGKMEHTGEVIDFRGLILTIWDGKWIILAVSITFGISVFLISSCFVPDRYRASATVAVTLRDTWRELIEKGISQMARSDDVLDLVYTEMSITELEEQRDLEFVAFMEYWGQLQLEVRAGDPELAASAANIWADLVYERIYEMLGIKEEFLEELEEDVAQAEANWQTARNALNDYLSESHLELYPDILSSIKSTLVAYREMLDRNRLILSDVLTLEGQIVDMSSSETLNSGIALNLFNLLGRAGTLDEEFNPLNLDDLSQHLELRPDEGLVVLQQFKAALEIQNQQLEEEVATLEEEVSDLANSLAVEQNQVEDLTLKRDLARKTYQELADQLTDFRIIKNEVDQSVKILTKALPPTEAYNPDKLTIAGFTGITAAFMTILGLLFFDWWVIRDDI